MASIIAIMGASGSGKTTSLRKLDPETTYIIDADRKGLSWQGWKRSYREGQNYLRESQPERVWAAMRSVSDRMPHIKTVIVDTVNSIMVDDEMRRMKEKGFDKWADLAQSVYTMVSESNMLRDDLVIVFVFHCEVCEDEASGHHLARFQTSGRKIRKVTLEAKFPTVLYSKAKGSGKYIFETQSNQSVAKSPMGMFADFEIPNDIAAVVARVREFDNDEGPVTVVSVEQQSPAFRAAQTAEVKTEREKFEEHGDKFSALFALQERDGVPNFKLIQYLEGKGWFKDCKSLEDLPDALLEALVKPENWAKVVQAVKPIANEQTTETPESPTPLSTPPSAPAPAATPAPESDVFDVVTKIRQLLKEKSIHDDTLSQFLRSKSLINDGQQWWEGDEAMLEAMIKPANWERVSAALTAMPF